MNRYHKVEKPKMETPIDENEIRITIQGRMRSCITYAMSLLQEKESDEIMFKAMRRAINKTVTTVELINFKGELLGLHQITSIQSTDITDTWEPWRKVSKRTNLPYQLTRRRCLQSLTMMEKDHLLLGEDEDLVGEGGGPEADQGIISQHMRTMMEAMSRIVGMLGVIGEVETQFAIFVRGGYNGSQVDNEYDAGVYNQEFPRDVTDEIEEKEQDNLWGMVIEKFQFEDFVIL